MKAYSIKSAHHCPRCETLVENFIELGNSVRRYECETCGLKYSHNLIKEKDEN